MLTEGMVVGEKQTNFTYVRQKEHGNNGDNNKRNNSIEYEIRKRQMSRKQTAYRQISNCGGQSQVF